MTAHMEKLSMDKERTLFRTPWLRRKEMTTSLRIFTFNIILPRFIVMPMLDIIRYKVFIKVNYKKMSDLIINLYLVK